MSKIKRKKILVDAYYAKNLGDDLFLKILFDRYPNVDWYMFGADECYKHIFRDYENVFVHKDIYTKVYRIFKNLRFKKYEAIVYIGGSIFMQNDYWKYRVEERENIIDSFKRKGKKAFILGANFGPYDKEEFKLKYKALFNRYDDVCFRDEFSYNLFKELKNVRIAPDIVFQLDKNKLDTKINKEKAIGFSIIDLQDRKDLDLYKEKYEDKIKEIIEHYLNLNYKINMFSFCKVQGDTKAIYRIINKIDNKNKDNIEVVEYKGDINTYLAKFKSMDTIVATRFHAVILGLIFEQNLVPLIYSDKTYNMLKDIGLKNYNVHIKDIEKLSIEKFTLLEQNNKLPNKNILKDSKKHFRKLDEFILSNQ